MNDQRDRDLASRRRPRLPSPLSFYTVGNRRECGTKRVLRTKGRHRSENSDEQVRIEPAGLAGAFVKDISLPVTDKRVGGETRRPITAFGCHATLEDIIQVNDDAAAEGVLDLK